MGTTLANLDHGRLPYGGIKVPGFSSQGKDVWKGMNSNCLTLQIGPNLRLTVDRPHRPLLAALEDSVPPGLDDKLLSVGLAIPEKRVRSNE